MNRTSFLYCLLWCLSVTGAAQAMPTYMILDTIQLVGDDEITYYAPGEVLGVYFEYRIDNDQISAQNFKVTYAWFGPNGLIGGTTTNYHDDVPASGFVTNGSGQLSNLQVPQDMPTYIYFTITAYWLDEDTFQWRMIGDTGGITFWLEGR